MTIKEEISLPSQRTCTRCNFVSSQAVCKACVLLEGLNKGLPKLGIGKSSKVKRILDDYNSKQQKENILDQANKELNDNSNLKTKGSKSKSKNSVVDKKCNSEKCCSGKCNAELKVDNSKINSLLEQYSLDERLNTVDQIEIDQTREIDQTEKEQSDNELINDDDGCSSSCGRLGSLHIGF